MESMFDVACGLDVHKETVVACVLEARPGKKTQKETKTYEANGRGLVALAAWLMEKKVEAIVMEGTGIYWRPVYAVLEQQPATWKLVVGNAMHVKNVPGRKTDVQDAEWLAGLVRAGLIRPSFVPPPEIRELRDLTRYRKTLIEDRTRQQARVHKVLQAANIKLDGVASDIFGVSGMLILSALAAGTATPKEMAQLARGSLRKKMDALEVSLESKLGLTHRQMLNVALALLDGFDKQLKILDAAIDVQVRPWNHLVERLKSIPGIDRVAAVTMLAELGPDMSVFPTAAKCASWAGVCPGNNESAGKSRDGRSQRGNVHLKTMLCQAAQSAARTRDTFYSTKFHKLKARRGHNKAVMAIAHKILVSAYTMLRTEQDFKELGGAYLDKRDRQRVTRTLTERLRNLGYEVTLHELPTATAG
jgi:transposase